MDAREHVIVCGVDGSPAGTRALEWALDEARRRDCALRAVTAWMWDGMESMGVPSSAEEARNLAEQNQSRALDAALAANDDPPDVERVLVRARPSEALTAASLDAEMLVLGSHGHGPLHDKLVGSTSQRAIRHAPCPVVVLPDPRHVEREAGHARMRRRPSQRHPAGPII